VTPVALDAETSEQRDTLNRLALLLSRGRADIQRGKIRTVNADGEVKDGYGITNAQIEEPWRGLQQIRNLARALARVHGRSGITDHDLELVRRVVLSSMPVGWANTLAAFQHGRTALTRNQIKDQIIKSYGRGVQLADELVAAEILVWEKRQGEYIYQPRPELVDLISKPVKALKHSPDEAITQNSPYIHCTSSVVEPASMGGGEFYEMEVAR
jgi:hypothetical protein